MLFMDCLVARSTARAFRTFCLRRTEAKGPAIAISPSPVGHCMRFEADCASFAKDAVPDLGTIVLKSTILSTEARAEAAGPVGAMPPQIFVHLQLLLETTDAHEDVK
jgi:hypothetical protein